MNFLFNLFWISESFLEIFLNFNCIKKLPERANNNTKNVLYLYKKTVMYQIGTILPLLGWVSHISQSFFNFA